MTEVAAQGFDLKITKQLPATREQVFGAWINADHLKQWISPMGSATVPILEPREGGKFQIDMHGEGETYVHTGEYLELRSLNVSCSLGFHQLPDRSHRW